MPAANALALAAEVGRFDQLRYEMFVARPSAAKGQIARVDTTLHRAKTARANENETVDDWTESDLAWELADAISPLLAERDRLQLYATIGSGDYYTAIGALLQAMAHQRLPMPTEFIPKLAGWLDAYVHSDDAPRLLELLCAIKSLR